MPIQPRWQKLQALLTDVWLLVRRGGERLLRLPGVEQSSAYVRAYPGLCLGLAVGIVLATLYFTTLYPGVGGRVLAGDSAKWQFLWSVRGTPHPTGYPLYWMVSKVFGTVLFFLPAWARITVMSAIFGLVTLSLLADLVRRVSGSVVAGFSAALVLGTIPNYWALATEAEVHTLHTFILVLSFWLLQRYADDRRHAQHSSERFLIGATLVFALGFGNHLTLVTALPAFLLCAISPDWRVILRPRIVGAVLACATLGASQYGLTWWISRGPQVYSEYLHTGADLAHFWRYVTGAPFQHMMFGKPIVAELQVSLPRYAMSLFTQFGLAFALAGLVGISAALFSAVFTCNRRILSGLLLVAAGQLFFALQYVIPDIEPYFLPAHLVAAVGVGLFVAVHPSRWWRVLAFSVVVVIWALRLPTTYAQVHVGENKRSDIWRSVFERLPAGAHVYLPVDSGQRYDDYETLRYYLYCDGCDRSRILHMIPPTTGSYFFLEESLAVVRAQPRTEISVYSRGIDLVDVVAAASNDTIVIAAKDEASRGLDPSTRERLRALGLPALAGLGLRQSYVGIIQGGRVLLDRADTAALVFQGEQLGVPHLGRVESAGFLVGNQAKIEVNGRDRAVGGRGLNIVVISSSKARSVESFSIDTHIAATRFPAILQATNAEP